MDAKLVAAINDQITKEYESGYLYLQMAAWLEEQNFKGFANWMWIQAKEEADHTMIFVKYLLDRGEKVTFGALAAPKHDFKSVLEVFEMALAHEQMVTARIVKLMDMACELKDYASRSRLNWFIDEQVEEEANANEMVAKVKMCGASQGALLAFDHQAAKRAYSPASALESDD